MFINCDLGNHKQCKYVYILNVTKCGFTKIAVTKINEAGAVL